MSLVTDLASATADAYTRLREEQPGERFYFFALFTTDAGGYVYPTAWSEEAFTTVVADYQRRYPNRTSASLERALRFSAPDSPYHGKGGLGFLPIETGPALHDACFEALQQLDRDGFFADARADLLLNVVYGDMSHERWLAHAKRLNPPALIDRALPFLHLHLPSGRVTRWGAGVYQVSALSLSADRSTVAYSGSGGEVGVLRVGGAKAIYERRRKGSHWACALSPDGNRLFLGDTDDIGVLDVWTGKHRSLVKTGKPSQLALSPDGARLAASSFDAPLTVFDARTGGTHWKAEAIDKAAIQFSPDGRWLAVVATRWENKQAFTTLRCFDAATGREEWCVDLGAGRSTSLVWSGEEVLAAASEWKLTNDMKQAGTASLAFFAGATGERLRAVPWSAGIDALAIAPNQQRIALCSKTAIVVLDRAGAELARGTGAQESLGACVFSDDDTVIAAGRDVNSGPALLSLAIG